MYKSRSFILKLLPTLKAQPDSLPWENRGEGDLLPHPCPPPALSPGAQLSLPPILIESNQYRYPSGPVISVACLWVPVCPPRRLGILWRQEACPFHLCLHLHCLQCLAHSSCKLWSEQSLFTVGCVCAPKHGGLKCCCFCSKAEERVDQRCTWMHGLSVCLC